MINTKVILCLNGSAILLLLIVLQSSFRLFHHKMLDRKLMNIMIITAIVECLLEIASYYNDGMIGIGHRQVGMMLKSLQYIGNSLFALTWTVYADYKLFEDTERLKKRYRILIIPAVFVVIGSIVNLFTPVFYWIDPITNVYRRSSINFITYLVVFF